MLDEDRDRPAPNVRLRYYRLNLIGDFVGSFAFGLDRELMVMSGQHEWLTLPIHVFAATRRILDLRLTLRCTNRNG